MYNHFFGFQERPFKLVPNPDYLYLSRAHEEALAHLKYAAAEGDGFVEIIGEVGTGKTLLCRAFLESLGPDTETAYIFNPKMDAVGLLQAINEEFGITADHASPRALIETLNAFLMEKKKAGQKVILLIDEAQNLGRDVLEQLRLLSNLETSRDKLLQIILVGQPELGEMLDSHELRQLGQRIALSCRLQPLTYAETRAYIAHRLRVAARGPAVRFTRAAMHRIHKYSGGIARLINIACDRALLVAYGMGRKKVTGAVARMAVSELASWGQRRRFATWPAGAVLTGALVAAVIAGIGLYQTGNIPIVPIRDRLPVAAQMADNKDKVPAEKPAAHESTDPAPASAPADKKTEKTPKPAGTAQKTAKKTKDGEKHSSPPQQAPASPAEAIGLKKYLKADAGQHDRRSGVMRLLSAWGSDSSMPAALSAVSDDTAFFSLAARQNGLYLLRIRGDLNLIKRLDVPAVLKFKAADDAGTVYLTVQRADRTGIILADGAGRQIAATTNAVAGRWTGEAFVFWKDFLNLQGIVGLNASGDTVMALKLLLQELGHTEMKINENYDNQTQAVIKQIQAEHGIPVDGYVGPKTKIVLYHQKTALDMPRITDAAQPKSADGMQHPAAPI